MSDVMLRTEHLTKDYGNGRGIYDISLEIKRGEVFGYIGTNGSGKTTTIRHMMGFVRGDCGRAEVGGMDSWERAADIKTFASYVPGEIAFPRLKSGTEFLKLQAQYQGITDFSYMNRLLKMFQLDATANLRRMSKGMKQKTALVAAMMGDREILILDEPTTGLDPLMREVFLDLIREEKAKGKTVFMSSHIFEEIEEVCDRAAIIRDGRIADLIDVYGLRHERNKQYLAVFEEEADAQKFAQRCTFAGWKVQGNQCRIQIDAAEIGRLLRLLKEFRLRLLSEEHETLEKKFRRTMENSQICDEK